MAKDHIVPPRTTILCYNICGGEVITSQLIAWMVSLEQMSSKHGLVMLSAPKPVHLVQIFLAVFDTQCHVSGLSMPAQEA